MFEEDVTHHTYTPFSTPAIKSKTELLKELASPCSRFTFDLTKINSDYQSAVRAAKTDPFASSASVLATTMPANWQAFIRYLAEEGVTSSPSVEFPPVRNGVPHIYTAWLLRGTQKEDEDGKDSNRYGLGTSYDSMEEALSKAVGELLERHSLSTYRNRDLLTATYNELKGRRFGPRPLDIFSLNGFLPWQEDMFPNYKRDADTPLRWVRGMNVTRSEPTYLPAQLVFWSYRRLAEETFLAEANTNGAAGHFTRDEAILSGLLELIQRDAFLIHWLKIPQPKRIDPDTITDPDVRDLMARLRRAKIETHLIDVTVDIAVPTCLCVFVDTHAGGRQTYIAASTGFDLRGILLNAMNETLVIYNLRDQKGAPYPTIDADYKPFTTRLNQNERLRIWQNSDMYPYIEKFISGPLESASDFMRGVDQYVTVQERLSYVKSCLARLGEGYDIYVYEAARPLLKKVGFHAVQVIVPRLISLYLIENDAHLASVRLTTVPQAIGMKARDDINPYPHPFP